MKSTTKYWRKNKVKKLISIKDQTCNCFASMMLRFQCGSRLYMKGKRFLGRFCVENGEVQVRCLEKPLRVEVGAPQDMEVESSCAWFQEVYTSNVEPVMFKDCRKWRYIYKL